MREKHLGFAVLIMAIAASLARESTTLACDRATEQRALPAAVFPVTSAAVWTCPAQPELLLVSATQDAKQDDKTRLGPRAWGKLIKVGIICLFLVGGGAVWLFNKLKAQ